MASARTFLASPWGSAHKVSADARGTTITTGEPCLSADR